MRVINIVKRLKIKEMHIQLMVAEHILKRTMRGIDKIANRIVPINKNRFVLFHFGVFKMLFQSKSVGLISNLRWPTGLFPK